MAQSDFEALVLRRPDGINVARVETLGQHELPDGDVLVRVWYSTVNYKDGLAITGAGHRQIVQNFPFVPGVDFSGTVQHSDSSRFQAGDNVILTGWGVGEHHWGGYAQFARVSSDWLSPLPAGMTLRQAMAYGSAGLSAMLCINALERYGFDTSKEVLVTGSGGGVGSITLMLLAKLGYHGVASTQRPELTPYLEKLGAERVVSAQELAVAPDMPLLDEYWGGAIDNVGGTTLSRILATTCYGGPVVSLGLVGGRDLNTTVMPFIKRAVALIGVDSVYCPTAQRDEAWRRLAALLPAGPPQEVIHEIHLADIPAHAAAIMKGKIKGRTIVAIE